MRKKFLAIIATAAMVVTMIPAMAFAGTSVTTEAELQNAVNAGGDITIGNDIALTGTITVPAGTTATIDLNGKTISGTCESTSAHMFIVENTATLNIKDTSTAGDGKITYAGSNSTGWIVDVEGNLNLYSGTLELTGTWSIGYCVDVRPNSWGAEYTEGTVFHMYGGKLISTDGAVRVASSSSSTHDKVSATFIMDDGSIEADWDGIFVQQSDSVYDVLSVVINDGSVSSDLAPIRFYGPEKTSSVVNTENLMIVTITGGSFEYTGDASGTWLVPGVFKVGSDISASEDALEAFEKDLEIAISGGSFDGGTFDVDASDYLAEDTVALVYTDDDDNTLYGVYKNEEAAVAAGAEYKVGNAYYSDYDKALAAANGDEESITALARYIDFILLPPTVKTGDEIPMDQWYQTKITEETSLQAALDIILGEGMEIPAYEGYTLVWSLADWDYDEDNEKDIFKKYTDIVSLDTKVAIEDGSNYSVFAKWVPKAVEDLDSDEGTEDAEDATDTGDDMNIVLPIGLSGLALAAMAAVVFARRRFN